MMTLLHSVWSGGGSAAGRRRSLLALGALLALVASVLIWAAPSQAQQRNASPPVAVASVSPDGDKGKLLSSSFDPGGKIVSWKWEVVTEAYSWLGIEDYTTAEAMFDIPSATLAARYGNSIEFKLTVTDDGTPILTDSTTVTFNLNQGPTADIAVSAMLADPANPDVANYDDNGNGVKDENAERYPLDGVIDGPGENGNADNEWDIAEGALITLDGSGSSDPGGQLPASGFDWDQVYSSGDASQPLAEDGVKKISTDEDPNAVGDGETMDPLTSVTGRPAPNFYVYYKLTVTDSGGASNSAIVKLVVHDQPANPRVATLTPSVTDETDGVSALSAEVVPPKSGKYVVAPGSKITVTATASDADGDTPRVSWEGAQATAPGALTAVFAAPSTAEEGDEFTITATAADITGRTGTKSVVLVVASNTKPEAVAPGTLLPTQLYSVITVNDGPDGGDVNPATGKGTGTVKLRGIGFDADGDPLIFNWTELAMATDADGNHVLPSLDFSTAPRPTPQNMPSQIKLPGKARVSIDNAFSEDGASFAVPEVTARDKTIEISHDGETVDALHIPIAFTVIDKWSVSDSRIVIVRVIQNDDIPVADAGPNQAVTSGSFVRLNGSGSSDSDPGDKLSYQWTYIGIVADPATDKRVPITKAEQGYGYVEGKWFPYDGKDADGNDDPNETAGAYDATAGGALKNATTAYPYFDAPQVGKFDSIKLKFRLVVTDGQATTDPSDDDVSAYSEVTITITDGFYGGQITGPDFCLARSLGGAMTYPFDSDGDGTADICSLKTTRRATIARQNALETLAALNPQDFKNHLHGVKADPDADPPVAAIAAQCASAPKNLGDSGAALAADSCGNGKGDVSSPPAPVDPAKADVFYSGTITGSSYCANASLGGPTTYAFDSDGDGVADICSLPFTRREAVARQRALDAAFSGHAQYKSALAAACTALGTSDFGDSPADLARDLCTARPPAATGTPLPTG